MHMEEEKDLERPVSETRQGGEVKVQKVEFHPLAPGFYPLRQGKSGPRHLTRSS